MRRSLTIGLLCTAAITAPLAATEPRPNIVFILSDDHSYPYLSCYGEPGLSTPALDRLASEGALLRNAFVGAPCCVPSRACLMTGRSAVACRMTRFSAPLPREEITFPELLRRDAGYFVGTLGRSYHLDGSASQPGAMAVLDEFHMRTFFDRFQFVETKEQESIPAALGRYFDQRKPDQPYFLWVNTNDPHWPWNTGGAGPDPASVRIPPYLPDTPAVRKALASHEGEIQHLDGIVATTLDLLRRRVGLDNTLIVFMGDNGMGFPGGKGSLRDPGIHVPMIAWWQGRIKPGTDCSTLFSGEDLAPTCLDAAGVAKPPSMRGISILPRLTGRDGEERRFIFAERGPHGDANFDHLTKTNDIDYSRCVRTRDHKLIYNVTPQLEYAPVDSFKDTYWTTMTQMHADGKLAPGIDAAFFAHPRPVFELYDLRSDAAELVNLAGQPAVADVESELKGMMERQMVLDVDYLPLPTLPAWKTKKGGTTHH